VIDDAGEGKGWAEIAIHGSDKSRLTDTVRDFRGWTGLYGPDWLILRFTSDVIEEKDSCFKPMKNDAIDRC
jgi:hypothetical protein